MADLKKSKDLVKATEEASNTLLKATVADHDSK
jgi:hypothetical protein